MFLEKSKNAPFNRGQWYKVFLESDGSQIKITTTDIENAELASGNLYFPMTDDLKHFHVIDYKIDMNTSGGTATSSTNVSIAIYRNSAGHEGVKLPTKDMFDYADIWVFGYYD